MKYCALILAAGNSTRFQAKINKLFYKINQKTVLELSLHNFIMDDDCKAIIVVYNPNLKDQFKKILANISCLKQVIMVAGGNYRHDSFVKGIKHCLNYDWVMVHDGARPFLSFDLIKRIKETILYKEKLDAIIPYLNIYDSLIEIGNNNIKYLNRNNIKIVQTPQCFKVKSIIDIINKNNKDYSDEFSWILSIKNIDYQLIEGDNGNFKITYFKELKYL